MGRLVLLLLLVVLAGRSDAVRVYSGTRHLEQTTARGWLPQDIYIEPSARHDRKIEAPERNVDRRSATDKTLLEKVSAAGGNIKVAPNLYKIKMTQRGYIQFLRYLADVPPIQGYTFCLWMTSRNLTNPHPLFSYSLNEKERLIGVWLNPADGTMQMGVRDAIILKVPVTIRENRWYHLCQSWNGITGDWAIFVDGKRKGSGTLHQYAGTYVPGKGDVVVGQELTDVDKGLDDGIEGEVFGFNMVDEPVDLEAQLTFGFPHFRPEVHPQSRTPVPPFKKMPQSKKTFNDIKAYLDTLPNNAQSDFTAESSTVQAQEFQQTLTDIGQQEDKVLSTELPIRFSRPKPRYRYKPPPRKVVVYERQGRTNEYPFESSKLDAASLFKRTGAAEERKDIERPKTNENPEQTTRARHANQIYNDNYSIHSYKAPESVGKASPYQIYELSSDDELTVEPKEGQRRARQNFDLTSAREGMYKFNSLTSRVTGQPQFKYHFEAERRKEWTKKDNRIGRRSFDVEAEGTEVKEEGTGTREFIPVYEVVDEEPFARRRRDTDAKRDPRHIQAGAKLADLGGFRRLPDIPPGFINIFAGRSTKSEMEQKLRQFFPNVTAAPTVTTVTAVAAVTAPPVVHTTPLHIIATTRPTGPGSLHLRHPQSFPNTVELVQIVEQEVEPSGADHRYDEEHRRRFRGNLKTDNNLVEGKLRWGSISSGTELVLRGYGLCGVDRGAPITDKRHLIVSWADTPVRIYGGALVANAKNICGYF